MKKLIKGIALVCLLTLGKPAIGQQINWINNLTWEQVKTKAKAENKMIFVDCMATWCLPCKKMDDEVYNQARVADIINKNFIPVKLQMDSTSGDNDDVKRWYDVAKTIALRYNVRAYPTYLFLSPEADLVFRDAGMKKIDKFLATVQLATDTGWKFGEQLKSWKKGGLKDRNLISGMLLKAEGVKDDVTAKALARDGIEYLSKQSGAAIYNRELIRAIGLYLEPSDKVLMKLFYPEANGRVTDSLIKGKGISAAIVKVVAEKEIRRMLVKDDNWSKIILDNPDWTSIKNTIIRKYGTSAERLVDDAKRTWYLVSKPDNKMWSKLAIDYHNRYVDFSKSGMNMMGINGDMWDGIFLKIDDKKLLLNAAALQLKVVNYAEQQDDDDLEAYIDTYANLLYKSGDVKKAIVWQKKAVERRKKKEAKRGDKKPHLGFVETLEKMKNGTPTWQDVQG